MYQFNRKFKLVYPKYVWYGGKVENCNILAISSGKTAYNASVILDAQKHLLGSKLCSQTNKSWLPPGLNCPLHAQLLCPNHNHSHNHRLQYLGSTCVRTVGQ